MASPLSAKRIRPQMLTQNVDNVLATKYSLQDIPNVSPSSEVPQDLWALKEDMENKFIPENSLKCSFVINV